jgi:hypothetical protein
MARQRTLSQTLKSIAGSALVGPGLVILFGNLDGAAARLKHLLATTPGEGLGVLASVILAASFDHQRLLQGFLQMLVSFWPLLFVSVGAVLLRDSFTENVNSFVGTQQILPEKDSKPVDLTAPRPSPDSAGRDRAAATQNPSRTQP